MLTTEKKSLSVGKYVDTAHVEQVIKNYKQERWVDNSKKLGKEDSLSGWWSVEEIEQFLEAVKEQGGDGVRMYFGAYDKDYSENPLFAGRQTLVMVGTRRKEGESGYNDKDIYVNDGEETKILAYNATRICPPYCGGLGGETGVGLIDKGNEGIVLR